MNRPLLLWIDLETTGIDWRSHEILEVAAILTTWDGLTELAQFSTPVTTSTAPERLIDSTDVATMHTANNLLIESRNGLPLYRADVQLAALVDSAIRARSDRHATQEVLVAGSGVAQFDRAWIRQHLRETDRHLHPYRCMDVSPIRHLMESMVSYAEAKFAAPFHGKPHRALPDVRQALDQYRRLRVSLEAFYLAEHACSDQHGADELMLGEFTMLCDRCKTPWSIGNAYDIADGVGCEDCYMLEQRSGRERAAALDAAMHD